jgi:hypothetical protein
MKLIGSCEWRKLAFSSDHIHACVTLGKGHLTLQGQAIVVNAGMEVSIVKALIKESLTPMASVQLRDVSLDATPNLILFEQIGTLRATYAQIKQNWVQFRAKGENINLWRSTRDKVGEVWIDIGQLRESQHTSDDKHQYGRFQISANLWFAPAGTNCLIHREHAFIEIHSQIVGIGHMQKFHDKDRSSLYDDVTLAPGCTTERPFCNVVNDGIPIYPWHQYYAESDSIWLAIEYHPMTEINYYE